MKWLLGFLGLWGARRLTSPTAPASPTWVPQPQQPRPHAPAVTRLEPRVLLGFGNRSAVVIDPASDVAKSMQGLAQSLRAGLHRGHIHAEDL